MKRTGIWAVPRWSSCKRSHYWSDPYCSGWGMRRVAMCGITESTEFIRGPGEKLPKCKRCERALV